MQGAQRGATDNWYYIMCCTTYMKARSLMVPGAREGANLPRTAVPAPDLQDQGTTQLDCIW